MMHNNCNTDGAMRGYYDCKLIISAPLNQVRGMSARKENMALEHR